MKKWHILVIVLILVATLAYIVIEQTIFSDESIAESVNEAAYQEISDSVDQESKEIINLIKDTKENQESADKYNGEQADQIVEQPEATEQAIHIADDPALPAVTQKDPVIEITEPVKEVTAAEILSSYEEGLDFLRSLAIEKLDMLIQNLMEEYNAMDPNEREKLSSKTALATKYIGLAKDLEARIDGTFYHLMDQLEADLIANSLSTESVNNLSEQYENEKEERRNDLLKKAMESQGD